MQPCNFKAAATTGHYGWKLIGAPNLRAPKGGHPDLFRSPCLQFKTNLIKLGRQKVGHEMVVDGFRPNFRPWILETQGLKLLRDSPSNKQNKGLKSQFQHLKFGDSIHPFHTPPFIRKILVSVKFLSANLGPEMAAPILWAPGKMRSFCRKTSMSIKFLVLGGGVFWV